MEVSAHDAIVAVTGGVRSQRIHKSDIICDVCGTINLHDSDWKTSGQSCFHVSCVPCEEEQPDPAQRNVCTICAVPDAMIDTALPMQKDADGKWCHVWCVNAKQNTITRTDLPCCLCVFNNRPSNAYEGFRSIVCDGVGNMCMDACGADGNCEWCYNVAIHPSCACSVGTYRLNVNWRFVCNERVLKTALQWCPKLPGYNRLGGVVDFSSSTFALRFATTWARILHNECAQTCDVRHINSKMMQTLSCGEEEWKQVDVVPERFTLSFTLLPRRNDLLWIIGKRNSLVPIPCIVINAACSGGKASVVVLPDRDRRYVPLDCLYPYNLSFHKYSTLQTGLLTGSIFRNMLATSATLFDKWTNAQQLFHKMSLTFGTDRTWIAYSRTERVGAVVSRSISITHPFSASTELNSTPFHLEHAIGLLGQLFVQKGATTCSDEDSANSERAESDSTVNVDSANSGKAESDSTTRVSAKSSNGHDVNVKMNCSSNKEEECKFSQDKETANGKWSESSSRKRKADDDEEFINSEVERRVHAMRMQIQEDILKRMYSAEERRVEQRNVATQNVELQHEEFMRMWNQFRKDASASEERMKQLISDARVILSQFDTTAIRNKMEGVAQEVIADLQYATSRKNV